ncbi:LysR family transcriptional regulator [Desmospora profundinema]|uniref:LysR family cyn operon transcriptional activator n=1 Tax=Desmospora profundinema TaxID=1571184 RepID=A0ABU1IMC4_9BACL|nr:LysR family transcriptional regulator [Desmospora profundinema]MDR6225309.1 LysR family cyn operon transcriptional activator [Desmospora profundinema]
MHINQLITFLEVAKTNRFREAARRLNLTQPAVSAQIRSLEESLGTLLFHRQPVSLTSAGHAFLPHARQILALAETGKRAVRDSQSSLPLSITVGASSGAALTVLPRLSRYFNGVRSDIRVSVHTLPVVEIVDGLHSGRLDAGIVYGSQTDPDLVSQVLMYDHFILITPKSHPLAQREHLPVAELTGMPMISLTPENPERQWLDWLLSVKKIHPETVIELSSVEEVKRAVRFGLGIALIPRLSRDDEMDRDLHRVRLSGFNHQFPIVLLRPNDRHLSPDLLRFLEDTCGIYSPEWED